jgi:TIR domain
MTLVHLFLSTVSEEFRSYREALRKMLTRPNVTVHGQEDFIVTGTKTLDKIDIYIQNCGAVIHLVGDRTGAYAQTSELQSLKARHPDLAERLPAIKPSLETGEPPLSYPQLEAYLAVYHRKALLIAEAAPEAPRDGNLPIDPESRASQRAHRERLRQLGYFSEIRFTNRDHLIAQVASSNLLASVQSEPWTGNGEFDVFVSYPNQDKAAADAACAMLEAAGIRCWIAPRDIIPGTDWGEAIIDAIEGVKIMVLIFSRHANASPQIKREVERAVNRGLSIITLRLENAALNKSLQYFLSTPHWLDAFTPPIESHLKRLVTAVRAILATYSGQRDPASDRDVDV